LLVPARWRREEHEKRCRITWRLGSTNLCLPSHPACCDLSLASQVGAYAVASTMRKAIHSGCDSNAGRGDQHVDPSAAGEGVLGRAQGRGVHPCTYHLNLGPFVIETTAESAHIRPRSGWLCTAVYGPCRGLHSSTSQLHLSRFCHCNCMRSYNVSTMRTHAKPTGGRV
jgi:hypothetical protein